MGYVKVEDCDVPDAILIARKIEEIESELNDLKVLTKDISSKVDKLWEIRNTDTLFL